MITVTQKRIKELEAELRELKLKELDARTVTKHPLVVDRDEDGEYPILEKILSKLYKEIGDIGPTPLRRELDSHVVDMNNYLRSWCEAAYRCDEYYNGGVLFEKGEDRAAVGPFVSKVNILFTNEPLFIFDVTRVRMPMWVVSSVPYYYEVSVLLNKKASIKSSFKEFVFCVSADALGVVLDELVYGVPDGTRLQFLYERHTPRLNSPFVGEFISFLKHLTNERVVYGDIPFEEGV